MSKNHAGVAQIFELGEIAKDIYANLVTYHMPHLAEDKVTSKQMQDDLPTLLVNVVRSCIEERMNPIARGGKGFMPVDYHTDNYAEKYEMQPSMFSSFIMDHIHMMDLIMDVDKLTAGQPWMLWEITFKGSAIIVSSLGDFRILEWERDHMEDGKYVNTLSKSE